MSEDERRQSEASEWKLRHLNFKKEVPQVKREKIATDMARDTSTSLDSSDSSDMDTVSSSTSAKDTRIKLRSETKHKDESIVELFRNFKFPKEIVAPSVYNPESGDSLREFLRSFERYFEWEICKRKSKRRV